ncbi:MAG: prephenate dehydrogenase/arogenate dehydrogenase family protein [Desulfobacteraceae bacterium]|jgi:prephenate dehydrogenase|nr:prephenate dehydrogenase/arogenate dehydrogenase family protein [Desulfobacteraceae bacterium]
MIGIIGFGRFGKLVSHYLSQDLDVLVYNRSDKVSEIVRTGAQPASLETVCQQAIVIPCVPISKFRDNLKTIAPLLKPGSLVIDVCSVKEYPVQWMLKELPDSVAILATHPMFGPDSAAESLKDRKICLCRVRAPEKQYHKIKNYLISKGLIIIEATAREHDEQIATSLSLTHLIGRTLSKCGAKPLNIDTEGYKRLLRILEVVERDTWQLFQDMHHYNPHAKKKRMEFIQVMEDINSKLEQGEFADQGKS